MGKNKNQANLAVNKVENPINNSINVAKIPSNSVQTLKRQSNPSKISATAKKLKLSESDCEIVTMADSNCSNQTGSAPITIEVLVNLLGENARTITTALQQRFDILHESMQKQNERIGKLESELETMKAENELLWCQLSKSNLVFGGVPDSDKETNKDLYAKVTNVIKSTTGKTIDFDTAYRVGKNNINSSRPIKVRFLAIRDRNEVYECRFKTSQPIYINEDLPFI